MKYVPSAVLSLLPVIPPVTELSYLPYFELFEAAIKLIVYSSPIESYPTV